jgi:anionic cell wall polymer biosynthesis LytR-Cps2A-Psr (LCP) family protein
MSTESRKIDYGIFVIVAIVAILVTVGVIIYSQVRTDAITEYRESNDRVAVLFVQETGGEAEFAQIVILDTRTKKLGMFDVPGHLGVVIEELDRIDRIDTLYNQGNVDGYRKAVAETFGIDLPFVISLTQEGMMQLVDLAEGVELFITESFHEEGSEQLVRLPAGRAVLDGAKVVDYAAAELPGETYAERAARAQKLTQALFRTLGERAELLRHEDVLPYVADAVEAGLDRRGVASLVSLYEGVDAQQVVSRRVQGNLRQVDTGGETKELLFPHFEGRWLRQTVSQVMDTLAQEGEVAQRPSTISVEILNGTTVTGLAQRTKQLYERYGFDVVSFDNADRSNYEHTLIIDRKGDLADAQRAAEIIRASRVQSEPLDSPIDVTIILGRDFDGTYVRQ